MSGQPYRYYTDPVKFRTQYMETLALQADINAMNLEANKTYKQTGQLPAVSQLKDTRTTSEILADTERLKLDLAGEIAKLSTPQFGHLVVQKIMSSPLNTDNKFLIFTAQRIRDIIENLKRIYKYGLVDSEDDAEQFVGFISTMYNDKNAMTAQTKTFMDRQGVKTLDATGNIYLQINEFITKAGVEFQTNINASINKLMNKLAKYSKISLGWGRTTPEITKIKNDAKQTIDLLDIDILTKIKSILDTIRAIRRVLPNNPIEVSQMETLILESSNSMNPDDEEFMRMYLDFLNHGLPSTNMLVTTYKNVGLFFRQLTNSEKSLPDEVPTMTDVNTQTSISSIINAININCQKLEESIENFQNSLIIENEWNFKNINKLADEKDRYFGTIRPQQQPQQQIKTGLNTPISIANVPPQNLSSPGSSSASQQPLTLEEQIDDIKTKLDDIETQLQDPTITSKDKTSLLQQKQKLEAELQDLQDQLAQQQPSTQPTTQPSTQPSTPIAQQQQPPQLTQDQIKGIKKLEEKIKDKKESQQLLLNMVGNDPAGLDNVMKQQYDNLENEINQLTAEIQDIINDPTYTFSTTTAPPKPPTPKPPTPTPPPQTGKLTGDQDKGISDLELLLRRTNTALNIAKQKNNTKVVSALEDMKKELENGIEEIKNDSNFIYVPNNPDLAKLISVLESIENKQQSKKPPATQQPTPQKPPPIKIPGNYKHISGTDKKEDLRTLVNLDDQYKNLKRNYDSSSSNYKYNKTMYDKAIKSYNEDKAEYEDKMESYDAKINDLEEEIQEYVNKGKKIPSTKEQNLENIKRQKEKLEKKFAEITKEFEKTNKPRKQIIDNFEKNDYKTGIDKAKQIIDEALQEYEDAYSSRPTGFGIIKRRGRPRGSGIIKPYSEVVKNNISDDIGIEESPRFVKFGRYLVNNKKLNNENIFALKRLSGGNIVEFPSLKISENLKGVIKKIIGGSVPTYSDINKLSEPEKAYLHKISQKSNILDKIDVPAPSKDNFEKDIHQFEVMKGEIMAGNDSKELLKKFKLHIVKLSRNGSLPKKEVTEILEDLAELGY